MPLQMFYFKDKKHCIRPSQRKR